MIKFDEEKMRANINGALALREEINEIVDELCERGFDNLCWFGIGGTYASSMQVFTHMKEKTAMDVFYESAAEYLTTGNKRITNRTVVIISSVTGSTEEMVKGVAKLKEVGATIVGFIDVGTTPLAQQVDYLISYPEQEQLKFFMTADRFMYNRGEFDNYEEVYSELNKYLADALIKVAYDSDEAALAFAQKHYNDENHYFIGAGSQWGATYSHAMCYWEEQHWLPARAVHSSDFFHGMFEIVTRDTAVTLFVSEDSQRSLSERVANFLPKICGNYTIIDTKDYELAGISEQNRGYISHLVIRVINDRIDAHIEKINRHPMDIRRYYRQLDY
ncbi:SIS domain-containing protein [Allofustis seminis]|uniref:SIS domain-containing protein n=1 Tax=Allofustis seminis TaxID=166939 RepID=UPI000378F1FC|nr:SIS domain-containing protein [Allofustis seminis]